MSMSGTTISAWRLPASTTVEVRRLSHPDLMVEIEAVALLDR